MAIDLHIIRQTQLSGLRQTDPAPFVAAGNALARAGQGIQQLGALGAEYASKQQAIENENFTNASIESFNVFVGEEAVSLSSPRIKDNVSTSKYGGLVEKNLLKKQQDLLKNIPESRRPSFLLKTNATIRTAVVQAITYGKTLNDADYRKHALLIKRGGLEAAAQNDPSYDRNTAINNYAGYIQNGVVTDIFKADVGQTMIQEYTDELVRQEQLGKNVALIESGTANLESVEQRIDEIRAAPILPSEQNTLVSNLLSSYGPLRAERRIQEKLKADQEERSLLFYWSKHLPDKNAVEQAEGTLTLPILKELVDGGKITNQKHIDDLQDILLDFNRSLNIPEGFTEDDKFGEEIERVRSNALSGLNTAEEIEPQLIKLEKDLQDGINEPFVVTLKDVKSHLKRIADIRKEFQDSDRVKENSAMNEARRAVHVQLTGREEDDPFAVSLFPLSGSIVADAQRLSANLVRLGADANTAAERALDVTQTQAMGQGLGIQINATGISWDKVKDIPRIQGLRSRAKKKPLSLTEQEKGILLYLSNLKSRIAKRTEQKKSFTKLLSK